AATTSGVPREPANESASIASSGGVTEQVVESVTDDGTSATPSVPPQAGGVDRGGSSPSVEEVEAQIRELEQRLDRMIRDSVPRRTEEPPRHRAEETTRPIGERLQEQLPIEKPGGDDGSVLDAARELLSSDYYLRQWGRLGMRNRSEEVDELGLDRKYEARWQPVFDFLYRKYFRVETVGLENIPNQGRCV